MPTRLILRFLGLPEVEFNDKPIARDHRKAIALLAYLTINDLSHASQRYSREVLSALFWPDAEQAKAFSNLRHTIWELHQAGGEDWLVSERESISLHPETEIDLDVKRFQDFVAEGTQKAEIPQRISALEEAVHLYRNHFLTGFTLKDAYLFNEWAYAKSEELRQQLADALSLLSEDYRICNQVGKAIPHALRWVALDPLNESAHRQLMKIYLQADQRDAALKQYLKCEQILRKELNLDPQSETRALYGEIRKAGRIQAQPKELKGSIAPKHNLPLQLSTFIGREQEINEVARLLGQHRLVTLAGVGGIGKTRVSIQVGKKVLQEYQDGVWLISFDSLSNPKLIAQTVASLFDIQERPDRPAIEILISVLREKTLLLILDNCEHLLDACVQLIKTLLINCPNLKVLVTSREILNMEGEAAYSLPPLFIPEALLSLEKQTDSEALQLFAERAALSLSSFKMAKENVQTILDICRRVDGIPLAIELAAARVDILQEDEILKQLNYFFELLVNYSRTALPRHQTMRASMDWSWTLLNEIEKAFMRQLSVFAGGWTLESAQMVCGGDVLNLTGALVKKSLIVVNQEWARETRYRFHEIVRQYAHEKLTEAGEEEEFRSRHLRYFLLLSEQAEPALKGPAQIEWHARLKDERDNIRASLEWADKTDVEMGLYLLGRLRRFWESLDVGEGARWLTAFLHKPESTTYPHARAKALCTLAWLLLWLQEFSQSKIAAQECLDLYTACGDKYGEIDGLLALGGMEPQHKALALSKSLGDEARQAEAFINLAWYDTDYHRRVTYMEEAVTLLKKLGDLESSLTPMTWLGNFEISNGNLPAAQKWVDEVMKASQSYTNTNTHYDILHLYGNMALINGDYKNANKYLQQASRIAKEVGFRWGLLWANVCLGYVALRAGDILEARDIFVATAQMFQNDQAIDGVVYTLEGIASLNVVVARPNQAARLIGWADATREKINDMRPLLEQADVDQIIAACLLKIGKVAFSDAYEEGQKMSLDEAVEYALENN